MYNFFFSYSRDLRSSIINQFIVSLEQYGFKLWYDKLDVVLGTDINKELFKTLNECKEWDGIILFMDQSFFTKDWCLKELDFALSNNLTLYPILFNMTKDEIPSTYSKLSDLNLCTIRDNSHIEYAICKVLFRFIINLTDSVADHSFKDHPVLSHLYKEFTIANHESPGILFISDSIVLCLEYLLNENNLLPTDKEKILFRIIHSITKKHYLTGMTNSFFVRIAVQATEKLLAYRY